MAVALAAGLALLPIGRSVKLGLALGFVTAYQALLRLSRQARSEPLPGSDPLPLPVAVPDESPPPESVGALFPSGLDLSEHVKHGAIYPRVYVDLHGNPLDGRGHYRIVGDMDMHVVWWSVTLYNEAFDLIPNTERHSFTSFNTIPTVDGRHFVIDVAPERPKGAQNWLPCQQDASFNLVWRTYVPGSRLTDSAMGFELPQIVRVKD
jgi:hypothetical protein